MSHEIVNGTQRGRGYEIHSCLKNEATKISCVLDKGYNSSRAKAGKNNAFLNMRVI